MKPEALDTSAAPPGTGEATAPVVAKTVKAPMETWQAVDALMALAHETRLAIFRLLVHAGPEGLSAGTISVRLRVGPSTLSHHLAALERAGLLVSRRLRRQIFYACAYDGMRGLLEFLTNDCCQGHPDLCGFTERPVKSPERRATACSAAKKRCAPTKGSP
jgi:DNA-binding transcriptional ArsR family regulator